MITADEVIVQVQALILFEFLFIFTAVRYLFVSSYSFLVIVFPSSYLSVQKCRTKERSAKEHAPSTFQAQIEWF